MGDLIRIIDFLENKHPWAAELRDRQVEITEDVLSQMEDGHGYRVMTELEKAA